MFWITLVLLALWALLFYGLAVGPLAHLVLLIAAVAFLAWIMGLGKSKDGRSRRDGSLHLNDDD